MFAILLSSHMDPFYGIISAFPTVLWTVLLVLFIIYWLAAVLGIMPIDFFPSDLDPGQSLDGSNALVGLMMRLGLVGIPLTISFSVLSVIGWGLSYFTVYLSPQFLIETWLIWPYGCVVFIVTGFVALILTGFVVRPLKSLFMNSRAQSRHDFIGALAQVRTSRVDEIFGEATIVDRGAGLIVQVRAQTPNKILCGDTVVILEYNAAQNSYVVAIYEDQNV